MKRRFVLALATLSLFLGLSDRNVRAQTFSYSVTDLGTLGGANSRASGINSVGAITGFSDITNDAGQQAFFRDAGSSGSSIRGLGTAGNSAGYALNATGQVTGVSSNHAFLSTINGGAALTDLGTLAGGTISAGYGVNVAGRVVGDSTISGGATHAFISPANGIGLLGDLGTLGGANSFGRGINASGQVAGYSNTTAGGLHAFISGANGGALRDLGTLGGQTSFGLALNDAGQVAGRSEINLSASHAFLSAANGGALSDLGTLGGTGSEARALNNLGQVVGNSSITGNGGTHAFLVLTLASGMVDLNNLIDPASGWTLISALGINDAGQIVGYGTNALSGGFDRAFLLTPVPEPGTVGLLALGAVAVVLAARRARRRQGAVLP